MSGLAFRAGGERFAVPIHEVREAARLGHLAPLPGAPARLTGLTFVRGEPLGVVDIGVVMGTASGSARMLVVLEGRPWALLVDHVEGIVGDDVPLLDIANLIGG